MNIIAQLFGIVALILMALSYQKSKKKDFLLVQVFANLFYALQYFCLNAISALVSNIVTIIKTLIFYKYEKENKKIPVVFLILFELIILILGIVTFKQWYSVIPIIIAMLYTFGTWQKNLKITYAIGIVASILWIYFNTVVGAYVSILGSVIELTSSTIGLIRVIKKKDNKK